MNIESMGALIVFLSIWEAIWTLLGLWYSARKDKWWFIGMGVFQLLGTIEIYYLITKTTFVKDIKQLMEKK